MTKHERSAGKIDSNHLHTGETLEELREAYENGATVRDISAALQMKEQDVYRKLRTAGTQMRKPGPPAKRVPLEKAHKSYGPAPEALSHLNYDSPIEELKEAYHKGFSLNNIAAATRIEKSRLAEQLHAAGTHMRPWRGHSQPENQAKVKETYGPAHESLSHLNYDSLPKELGEEYEKGASIPNLAAATGIHPKRIRKKLENNGTKIRPPGSHVRKRPRQKSETKVDQENPFDLSGNSSDQDISRAYEEGESAEQIAVYTEQSPRSIYKRLHRAGAPIPKPGAKKGSNLLAGLKLDKYMHPEKLGEIYESGASIKELATATGTSEYWVGLQLAEAGTTIRSRVPRAKRPVYASSELTHLTEDTPLAEFKRLHLKGHALWKIAAAVGRSTSWLTERMKKE